MGRTRRTSGVFPGARFARAGFPTVCAVLAFLFWWLLHSHTPVQGDDFTSAALGGATHGRFTLAAWWHQAVHDWWSATGRQSGTVFRVFQRMGTPVLRVVLAVVEVLLALVLGAWARRPGVQRGTLVVATLLGFAGVPVVAGLAPGINGDAIFWMLASFDYVFSPMMALLAGRQLVRIAERRGAPGAGWLPVLLLAPVLHETGSAALLALSLGVLVVRRGRLGRREWLAQGTVLVGCLLQVSSPGLWKRLGGFTGRLAETGLRLRLHQSGDATSTLLALGHWELLALGVVLIVACLAVGNRRAAGAGAVMLAAVAAAWPTGDRLRARGHLGYTTPFDATDRHCAVAVTAATGLALVSLLVLAWLARRELGDRLLLAVLGAGGAFGPTLLAGVTTPRAYLPALLWLWAALGVVSCRLLERGSTGDGGPAARWPVGVVTVLTVAAVVLAGRWCATSRRSVVANEAVHAGVLHQIAAAARGERDEVVFPSTWPAPDYLYTQGFLLSRYAHDIRLYYGLPAGVRLVRHP